MRFNIVFVGSAGAGKTSLIQRHFTQSFPTDTKSTLGVDFETMVVDDIEMAVWDTAGQERFQSITSSYFARGHVFVLVHDISDSSVDNDLKRWHRAIVSKKAPQHTPVIIVVSNKTDITPFCTSEMTNWVNDYNFDHVFTSTVTGEGMDSLFTQIHDAVVVHQSDWLSPTLPSLPHTLPAKASPGCNC